MKLLGFEFQISRAKNATTLKDPEFGSQFFGAARSGTGATITPDTAMRISAVYGCVRILAETVSSLPLHVYRRTATGRELVPDHPLNNLLGVSVNGEQTAMEAREFQMTSLGLRGNAYGQVLRSNRGGVGEIHPLKPAFMNVTRGASGQLVFDYQEPGNSRTFNAQQLWRVAALGSDGVLGLSPIALARESMGLAVATEQSAAGVFSNGAQSAVALEFPSTLTPETIKKLREQWVDQYAGYSNHHKPLILESGMKATNVGMSLSDAQFLESRKFQIAEIARWYRVPLHMLAELDKATFSNIEHQSIEFVVHTIRPWLVRLEQTAARDLLTPRERSEGLYLAHTVEGLLRGDTKARYEGYDKAIGSGWMNRNEVRKLENLNPVDGLDEYLIPMNMGTSAEAVEDMASAENRVLFKEAEKRDGPAFAAWAIGFYNRQEKRLGKALGVDATGYAAQRLERLAPAATPEEAAQVAAKHTADDIEALTHE